MERQEHNSLNEAALQVQLNEGAKDAVKSAVKSGVKTVWETLPLRGDVERKLKGTTLGKYARKKLSGTRSLYDINAGLPAGGAEQEVDAFMGDEKKQHEEHIALEYFNNYFGDNLNENTTDEDIMEAIYNLVELRDAVCEVVDLDEEEKNRKQQ